ncbi:MAG: hypothetical protein NTZ93_05115 [Candidatus Beckwithbacteria bacterium]|nr:hypothetical protein [Candidatus Beckwithbacteria bacterium]
MADTEAPILSPYECLVPVDKTERKVIQKTITYLNEYGTKILVAKGHNQGRIKVSFFEDPFSFKADAVMTILTILGRQSRRRPARFSCLMSGVAALRDGVNIGIIPEGITLRPTKQENRPIEQLQNREPELVVTRLLHCLENDLPIIDVEFKKTKWQTLHHEVLERSLGNCYLEK